MKRKCKILCVAKSKKKTLPLKKGQIIACSTIEKISDIENMVMYFCHNQLFLPAVNFF